MENKKLKFNWKKNIRRTKTHRREEWDEIELSSFAANLNYEPDAERLDQSSICGAVDLELVGEPWKRRPNSALDFGQN